MRSRTNMLASLVTKVSGPRDAAVLISGGPGSGKSWMLRKLQQLLGDQPHVVLRTSPGEADWPLSGLMMLLSGMDLETPIDVEPFLAGNPTSGVDTYALARHLQVALPERMKPGTVVLIDDLDLMDRESLKIISFLATKMQRIRTKFIGTICQDPAPRELSALQLVKLNELTAVESLQLAREHGGPTADESVLALVAARAHGIPGTLIDQLELLPARQLQGHAPLCMPLQPTNGHRALLATVRERLEPGQLQLLHYASIAPVMDHGAPRELGVQHADLDEVIQEGLLEQVGRFLELPDQALRSALYWSLDSEQRRALHQLLEPVAGSTALSLYHRSFNPGQEVGAAELLDGAVQLVHDGHVLGGIELAERALGLAGREPAPSGVLIMLSLRLAEQVELPAAKRYLRFARQLSADPATELQVAILLAEFASASGGQLPEIRVTDLVRQHRQEHPVACGQLLASVAVVHALRENSEAARSALSQAEELLVGAPDENRLRMAHARVLLAALDQDHATVLAAHQRLLAAGGTLDDFQEKMSLALALLTIGYHQEAREILARMSPAGSAPTLILQRLHLLLSAVNAIMNDNLPRAMSLVERWIAVDGPPLLEPFPQLAQAWYWMHKARPDMAGIFFEQMQPNFMGECSPRAMARIALLGGDQALMGGQHERAVDYYQSALRNFQGPADLRYVKATTGLLEALAMLGRTEEAVNEYRARQHQMSSVPGRRARMTMRLAQALVLEPEASLSRFQSLIDEWTPSDSTFELARVRHALGNRLRAMGQAEAAREHLVAARSLYRSLGAKAWMANAEDCLVTRTPVSGNPAPVDLSREEFQVVRMVHEGLTNKAIAKELYISVSAVEARLTKLYRRTGAKNRQQLASRFVDSQGPAGS